MPSLNSPERIRNLLPGLVAMQMDFVDRGQLAATAEQWLRDSSRPINELLVEQGALHERDGEVFEQLAIRHIEQHGGEPKRSLDALCKTPSVKEILGEIEADEVDFDPIGFFSTLTKGDSADEESTLSFQGGGNRRARSALNATSVESRFRTLRPLAKGGLGEVSVAEDTELRREVALKEIQSRFADDRQSRERFLLEAEVTASLEHPGIVPVYGMGRHPDGKPYYAMRLIKGDSMRTAVDHLHGKTGREGESSSGSSGSNTPQRVEYSGIEFRQLLGRFVSVCQTIEYAHSRNVLHRDIKPDNVMLGEYGETLVVDWGLAKPTLHSDPQSSETDQNAKLPHRPMATQPGAIGTPAFMPPEQASGDLDRIGPHSDVYSLGATLYYLLTGKPPFHGKDVVAMLDEVKEGRLSRPGKLKPGVPKPLEAVCLKAMAHSSNDRYPSAKLLAEDVERYLADESVNANSETWSERLGRLGRRHRTLVRVGVGALAMVAIVSVIAVMLISSARLRERTALMNENAALAEASKLNTQFENAIDTYVDVVNDDKMIASPQFQPLRKRLLASAVSVYDARIASSAFSTERASEQVETYFRIADVARVSGDSQKALEVTQRAFDLLGKLVDEDPNNAGHREAQITAANNLGQLLINDGELTQAKEMLGQSIQLARDQITNGNANAGMYERLATMLNGLADANRLAGEPQSMITNLNDAISTCEAGLAKFDKDDRLLAALALSHANLGMLGSPARVSPAQALAKLGERALGVKVPRSDRSGKSHASRQHILEAIDLYKQLRSRGSSELRLNRMHHLANCFQAIAFLFADDGLNKEAREYLSQGNAILEVLVEELPLRSDFRASVARGRFIQAIMDEEFGALRAAEVSYRRAVEQISTVRKLAGVTAENTQFVGVARLRLALVQQRIGKRIDARAHVQRILLSKPANYVRPKAIGGSEKLKMLNRASDVANGLSGVTDRFAMLVPAHRRMQFAVGLELRTSAFYNVMLEGELEEARKNVQRAIERFKRIIPYEKKNPAYRAELAVTYDSLATILLAQKKDADALEAFKESLKGFGEIPNDSKFGWARPYAAIVKVDQARTLQRVNRSEDAIKIVKSMPTSDLSARGALQVASYLAQFHAVLDRKTQAEIKQLVEQQIVKILQHAATLGFDDWHRIETDPRFAQVRTTEAYYSLMKVKR